LFWFIFCILANTLLTRAWFPTPFLTLVFRRHVAFFFFFLFNCLAAGIKFNLESRSRLIFFFFLSLSLSLSLFFFWRKAKAHPWSREETNEDIIRVHTRKGFLLLEATIRVRSDSAFYLSWNVTTLGRFSILVLHAWFDLISNQHINCSLAITSVINHRN
jgi:hypothetical protein